MSLFFVHARATLAAAFGPASRAKAVALVFSVGFALFCCSLMLAEVGSTDAALTVMEAFLFVLVFGLSMMAVPLWRGLLWSSDGPVVLPLRPRAAGAVEGSVFALLTLIPMGALWATFWVAMGHAIQQGTSLLLPALLFQGPIVGGVFLLSAPAAAQMRSLKASKAMWVLLALPGLAGLTLGAGLATDQSTPLYMTIAIMGVFAAVLTFMGATRLAKYLVNRADTEALSRPGRLDRLAIDSRNDIIRSMAMTAVLSLLGWLVLGTFVSGMVDQSVSEHPLQSWWGGMIVILPLLPRLSLTGTQLGIRRSDTPTLQAWSILPVHAEQMRRHMLVMVLAPLATGLLVDIAYVALQSDPLDWLSAIAKVNIAASILCGVLVGGATYTRLPRAPLPG